MSKLIEKDLFYADGELKVSLYALFRFYYNEMERLFQDAKLEEALYYEEKIKSIKGCFLDPMSKEEVEYEMHMSKSTQLSWPFRKRKGTYADYLRRQKEIQDTEDYLYE